MDSPRRNIFRCSVVYRRGLFTIGNATCGTISIFPVPCEHIAEDSSRFFGLLFILLRQPYSSISSRATGRAGRGVIRMGADWTPFPTSFPSSSSGGAGHSHSECAAAGTCCFSRSSWCAVSAFCTVQCHGRRPCLKHGKSEVFRRYRDPPTSILIVLLLGVAFSRNAVQDHIWVWCVTRFCLWPRCIRCR